MKQAPIPLTVTEQGDRAECYWYEQGRRPRWAYHAKDKTIWCDECLPHRCGICTIGPHGRGYWPPGFERPELLGLPLFGG